MSDAPRDRIADWLLGELTPEETAAFEAEMRRDPALRAEALSQREALTELALSTPVEPSAALRDRVLAATGGGAPSVLEFPGAARRRVPALLGWGLAASLLLAAAASWQLARTRGQLDVAAASRDSALAQLATTNALVSRLTDSTLETITLVANKPAEPLVQLLVDRPGHRAVLSAAALPTIPDDRAYQLWFIVDGTPQPSVTFRPGAGGRALALDVALPDSGRVQAVAVTMEPRAGSTAPTLPILYSAPVSE